MLQGEAPLAGGARAIPNSLIALYYYLMVIRQMYIQPAVEATPLRIPPLMTGVLAILMLGVIFIGVYPVPLVDAIDFATGVLLAPQGIASP